MHAHVGRHYQAGVAEHRLQGVVKVGVEGDLKIADQLVVAVEKPHRCRIVEKSVGVAVETVPEDGQLQAILVVAQAGIIQLAAHDVRGPHGRARRAQPKNEDQLGPKVRLHPPKVAVRRKSVPAARRLVPHPAIAAYLSTMLYDLYRHNLTLLTDLYQLTMAAGYWHAERHDRRACFQLYFREHPFNGHYTVAAGLAQVIDYLQHLQFDVADIQYLGGLTDARGQSLFDESFLNYLQRFNFSCSVDAVPEGTIVQPNTPLIRVTGPLLQCQLIETALLNFVNFASLIATKARRICTAAGSDAVLEFGLRRAQGIDGGLTASRAAYLGGCAATSNVLAGKLYGIPVRGTHAHSWVMVFGDELTAFRTYADAQPGNCIFLVDTYDTLQGVRHAITVGEELRARGYTLNGIRLDSGDLAQLSSDARRLLDAAGFPGTRIVASDSLDEYRIAALKANDAQIAVWGVGTRLATAYDQPALGGVYKLTAVQNADGHWEDRIKLSANPIKTTIPGIHQVRRYRTNEGWTDLLYDVRDGLSKEARTLNGEVVTAPSNAEGVDVLVPIFDEGELVYTIPPLKFSRNKLLNNSSVDFVLNLVIAASLWQRRVTLGG